MRVEWTDILDFIWSKTRSVVLFNGKGWQETGDVVKNHTGAPNFWRKLLPLSSVYCVNGATIFDKKVSIIYWSTAYHLTHYHNFLFGSYPSLHWKLNHTIHTDFKIPYVDGVNLYSSPNIVHVIKSRRMRWAGNVARMGEERGCIGSW